MEIEVPVDVTRVDPVDDDIDPADSLVGDASWLRRGQTISRYVIVECLGVGGMGIVYVAWDPKLDRKLAIKLVRARLGASGGTRGRNRLMREAQALACVRHPNVVTVHDVGTHEGRVFVAMEFIEGTTLQLWLEQQPERPFRDLLDVFLQAGRGLAAAHRAGLIHRDFKPENVMIGNDGRVVVLDFGIARGPTLVEEIKAEDAETVDAEPEEPEEPELAPSELVEDGMTRPGAIVGTPSYMSPEQRRRRPLDRRSDQFSYCVALWEALSGERPFGEGPAQKLLARMRLAQFRPMQRRGVPRRVIQALHRGLAWESHDRFPTMEALLEALNPRARAPRRLPLALLGGALAIAATLAGMLVGSWSQRELEAEASSTRDDVAAPEPAPEPEPAEDHERLAELRAEAERIEILFARSEYQTGTESARRLLASARELGDPPLEARALLLLGNFLERTGAHEEAERVLLEASRIAASAREVEIAAEAIHGLAGLLGARGLHDEALRWLEFAEGVHGRSGDPLRVQNLALRHDSLGRCPEARALLDAGLSDIAIAAPEGIEHARLLSSRASLCDYADESALEHIDHAAAIHERLAAEPDRNADRIDRSLALLAHDRLDDALAELEPVLEAELPAFQRARLDAATGLILHALGRDAEALEALIRASPDLQPGSPLARRVANAITALPPANE